MTVDKVSTDVNSFEADFRTAAEANSRKAGELEEALLGKIEGKLERMDAKELASALQAVANMKARNIEKLRAGSAPPEQAPDSLKLIASMVNKGYLKLSGPLAELDLVHGDDQ